jgi:hypothetical protein
VTEVTAASTALAAMRVTMATDSGTPGWPNEDFAAAAPGAAVLLDGATQFPRDADSGCVHGVAWYARTLGAELLAQITAEPAVPLPQALSDAIAQVRARHEGTCDLDHPASPASTVTAVRLASDGVQYLALSDSVIAADLVGADPVTITDHRRLGRASIASTDPAVAFGAVTGTFPLTGLRGVALLSDGATRITDKYDQLSWLGLVELVRDSGPAALIRRVRDAEAGDPDCARWPRSKANDDATALYWPIAD